MHHFLNPINWLHHVLVLILILVLVIEIRVIVNIKTLDSFDSILSLFTENTNIFIIQRCHIRRIFYIFCHLRINLWHTCFCLSWQRSICCIASLQQYTSQIIWGDIKGHLNNHSPSVLLWYRNLWETNNIFYQIKLVGLHL